jgi:glutamate-1-semialdehyde 2,1-aminomutase
MNSYVLFALPATPLALWILYRARLRLALSAAKHRSLAGHARWSRRIARLLPFYEYSDERFFAADGAPEAVVARRQVGFKQLAEIFTTRFARSAALTGEVAQSLSDLQFTARYRVPFQFSRRVREQLKGGSFLQASAGTQLVDLDGNRFYDLAGSYGVNVFGYDFYKECMERGAALVRDLGPVLGTYHPIMAYNVRRLREISGMDEVSFHMSGTEAVMQAVRLARYHTGRRYLVRFCGAYHGWWGDVQPGVGNPATAHDTYTLKEMSEQTLKVLRMRRDIACVLINPLQALHPNANAPNDGALVDSSRRAGFDREAYSAWLRRLREVCTARGIVLIFDEVFVGFRLAPGGAQEYFGVRADMVTYGKTLGGGLPVGVVCGPRELMRRYREDHPADVCLARGTFNAHPYVMGAMHEFLERLAGEPVQRLYRNLDALWSGRAAALNARFEAADLPVRVANLTSIWTVGYARASQYNWMFQYYLRAHGLALSWVGTGRFIFSHNYTDADFAEVADRIIAAARDMDRDGWWWTHPTLTNRAIRRRLLREVLQAWWRGSSPAAAKVTSRIGSMNSPRSSASGAR